MCNNIKLIMTLAVVAVMASACSSDSLDLTDVFIPSDNGASPGDYSSDDGSATTTGDLTTFDIAVDTTTAVAETEILSSDDENNVASATFAKTVTVVYSGSSARVTNDVDGVTVSLDGANVTVKSSVAGVNYVLSGVTADGQFKIYSDKKFSLTLNGVSITNPDGPAINSQSGKRAFVVLADGTTNTLTDGTDYATSSEDQKGTLFAEGKLIFSGSGKLRVYANCKAAVSADDWVLIHRGVDIYIKSTKGNGIKVNDDVTINGGCVNIETSGTASKAISSDGTVNIAGGRTTVITTGGGEYDSDDADVSACAGVKADSTMTVSGGELLCKSTGAGGKGISTDQQLTISGGTVKVITTGKTYAYSNSLDSKAKGIKSDGDMTISGGKVMVRATGCDGSEGIESKGTLTISGGQVESYSYDDAINSASHMYIKGGNVFAYGINNDGLDANGNLYIQGGTTVAYGTSSPEQGVDANTEGGYSLYITGGTLVGVGGGTTYPSSASTQPSIVYGGTVSNGTTLTVNGSSALLSFTMGRSYNTSAVFLISSPNLTRGSSYSIYSGAAAADTDWHGLVFAPTVSSAGSQIAAISSLSSPYSSVGSGGTGGMGGGMGGRPGGR